MGIIKLTKKHNKKLAEQQVEQGAQENADAVRSDSVAESLAQRGREFLQQVADAVDKKGIILGKPDFLHRKSEESVEPKDGTDVTLQEQQAESIDFAEDRPDQDDYDERVEDVDSFDNNRAVVSEDTAQTTENSRLFYLNNGTAVSVISAAPSNFYNETDRRWEKIDNTLNDIGDEFENVRGAFRTRIAKADKKRAVSIEKKGLQVKWEFIGKQKSQNSVAPVENEVDSTGENGSVLSKLVSFAEEHVRPETTLEIGDRIRNGLKRGLKRNKRNHRRLFDRAVYNNADEHTDLEYRLFGDRIKENIVVREKSDDYRYEFALQTQGLQMRLSEDNRQIELYSEKTSATGETEQSVEFAIPAPYMYDATGESCDEVFYEIEPSENGKCVFIVVASAEWINAENRSFPITIDPQITSQDGQVISTKVETRSFVFDSCMGKCYGNWKSTATTDLVVSRSDNTETQTTITIYKNRINILHNRLAGAVLVLTNTRNSAAKLYVDNKLKEVKGNGKLEIDLTDKFASNDEDDIEVHLTAYEDKAVHFSNVENAPYIVMEYLVNEKIAESKRDIELVGSAAGVLNIATGEFAPEIGIASGEGLSVNCDITQIYKQSSEDFFCGNNFRMNLDERLKEYGGRYIYTDMYGIKHGFTEHFYYINDNGNKATVEKKNVKIGVNGEMTYEGKDVFREEMSDSGLRASTRVKDLSGVKWVEQRESEMKQLEDQIAQYKNTLEQFVVVDKKTAKIACKLKGNFDIIEGGEYCGIVLPENEANSYVSMALQAEASMLQDTSYKLQKESLDNSITGLDYQDIDEKYGKSLKDNYNDQKENTDDLYWSNIAQRKWIRKQLDELERKCEGYIKQIEQYYKEYLNKTVELEMRKRQTPINYIMSGELIKGFNEDGELVLIADNYNNAVAIERDDDGRIVRVYDDKEKQITFKYNHKGLLSSVIDVRGRRTATEYSTTGCVKKITYENGNYLTIDTDESIRNAKDKDNFNITGMRLTDKKGCDISKVDLSYRDMMLSGVTYRNLFSAIAHGQISGDGQVISTIAISYGAKQTSIQTENDTSKKEIFIFNGDGNLVEYYVEEADRVVQAERYEYDETGRRRNKTEYAKDSLLHKKSHSSFAFETGESTLIVFDQFGNPTMQTDSGKIVNFDQNGVATTQTTVTTYEYNDDRRVVSERATVTTENGTKLSEYVSVKKYAYNAQGSVVRTESYVEGEELTRGVNIEETVYDDKGHTLKSFTYNSLDSSSKFYTESEIDEDGKVLAEIDETGENKTRLDYVANSDNIGTKLLPNGSKFGYGYDIDDNVTAITQSTEDGEGNSTQTEYTADVVTKLTSGNNTVRYDYDHKLRKTNVYLNSDAPYVVYTFSDKITENGKVVNKTTATLINGDISESVSDMRGNVLSTKYVDYQAKDTIKTLTTSTYDAKDRLEHVEVLNPFNDAKHTANYMYDEMDRTTGYTYYSGAYIENPTNVEVSETYIYDDYGKTNKRTIIINGDEETYIYAYKANAARDLDFITINLDSTESKNSITISPKTDLYGRNTGKEIAVGDKKIAEENIYYRKVGDHATNMPVSMRFGNAIGNEYSVLDRLQYKYDNSGNITEVRENGILQARYEYDKLSRLVREDNKPLNKTVLFSYDNNGNILSKRELAFSLRDTALLDELADETILYGYDGDRLLSFGDESFQYDVIGNPEIYRGKEAKWRYGRQLAIYDGNTFEYDGQGRRTKKNGISFTYDSNGKLLKQSNGISFIYDNSGVVGLRYNSSTYIYRKDIQGNIIAILDSNGDVMVEYKYDAWGNHSVLDAEGNAITSETHIGNLNPFRYRGYYYDTETKLYYLKSRYYDSEVGRFITIDDLSYLDSDTINGLNLYAYCGNNPVMAIDPNGNAWYDWLLGAVSLVAGIALCFVPGGQVFGAGLIVNGVSSLVSCSLQAAGVDNKITSIITSGLSIVSGIALCCIGLGSIGAGMIGQGIGSIAGGFISEACGGSFALGAAIGGFAGSIIGGFAYRGIQNFRLNRMTPYQKGVMGEKYVQRVTGMKAHTENTGRLRPDFIDRDRSILIDAKNVTKQGLTNQLRSYKGIGMNKTVVYVRLHTKVSTALKNSGIIIKYFPW